MVIAIDCRWIDSSGIGVYIRECLPLFLKSNNYFYLLGDSVKLQELISGCKNAEILDCNVKTFSLRELFFFPEKYLKIINKSDCYYSPYFNVPGGIRVPIYLTIHDMIFPDIPELTSRFGLSLRMLFYRRAFTKARKIFTVSNFSKLRIEHYSGGKVPVVVTHSAIQPWILQSRKDKIEKNNTIVFIGNIKKHKGLDCLFDAFLLARAEGLSCKLVIIGSRDNFRSSDNSFLQKIDSLGPAAVLFTGFITNQEMLEYLSSAALLVQPSLYEGFGLPPLEAMVLGTQALISDIPALKEIYSEFPVTFFKAGDPADLKEKLLKLLHNQPALVVSLSEPLLSKYTFDKTAATILQHLT